MVNDYLNVFLSDRYVNYQILGQNLSENELQLQKSAKIQRNVQESCLLRASMIGIGSGVLGSLVGTFLYSINMSNSSVDTEVSVKKEFLKQYKNFVPYVKSTIKSFAKLGFLYSLFECLINKVYTLFIPIYLILPICNINDVEWSFCHCRRLYRFCHVLIPHGVLSA
uniref:Mitochondrial import inner membrane translocase subunit, putative n=1 Tax=Theileria annulata TaxID=5874 RepID=A0A3B0MV06_THEAN